VQRAFYFVTDILSSVGGGGNFIGIAGENCRLPIADCQLPIADWGKGSAFVVNKWSSVIVDERHGR
jgi:hypothetical protein